MISFYRNYVIQYLPVPITDIILMKTSEKERMEKLQFLMSKVLIFRCSMALFHHVFVLSLILYAYEINNEIKIHHRMILFV